MVGKLKKTRRETCSVQGNTTELPEEFIVYRKRPTTAHKIKFLVVVPA